MSPEKKLKHPSVLSGTDSDLNKKLLIRATGDPTLQEYLREKYFDQLVPILLEIDDLKCKDILVE